MALGDPYVVATDLIGFLKMTTSDNDVDINRAVVSASRWIEGYCRRQFNLAGTASSRQFDAGVTGDVLLTDIGDPAITVATDSALDGTFATAWAGSDFQTQPFDAIVQGRPITSLHAVGNLRFPAPQRRIGLVRVTAKWGWPSVPDEVVQACLIQAGHIYKRRESTEGVMGFTAFGPVRVGSQIDPDVVNLLADFKYAAAPA